MRVLYVLHGSRGDVEPHAAFARGLVVEGGHDVKMVVPIEYAPLVATEVELIPHPITFTDYAAFVKENCNTFDAEEITRLNGECIFSAERIAQVMGCLERVASGWADVIVAGASHTMWLSATLAEQLGTGFVVAAVQECMPTSTSFFMSGEDPPPPFLNLFLHRLLYRHLMLPDVYRSRINAWRAGVGMRPLVDPWEYTHTINGPVLIGLSPHLFPPPSDWAPYDVHVVGTWVREAPSGVATLAPAMATATAPRAAPGAVPGAAIGLGDEGEPLPRAVLDFLSAGEPPVYLGWGSMPFGDTLTELAVRACYLAGRRAILLRGSHQLPHAHVSLEQLDPTAADAAQLRAWAEGHILIVEDVSHAALFPKVACIVHHGGAGTSAAALRSGVPSFAIPVGLDQFTYARVHVRLGVGPGPVRTASKWTPLQLSQAITTTCASDSYRHAAQALRMALLAEPSGVSTAVRVFEQVARRRPFAEAAARGYAYSIKPPHRWWWPLATLVFVPPPWLGRAVVIGAAAVAVGLGASKIRGKP